MGTTAMATQILKTIALVFCLTVHTSELSSVNQSFHGYLNQPTQESDYVLVEGDIKLTLADFLARGGRPSPMKGARWVAPGGAGEARTATGNQGSGTSGRQRLLRRKGRDRRKSSHKRTKRAVTALQERLWPNATIPYVIGPNITGSVVHNIYQAMGHWEKHTCIQFVNRTESDTDYIVFAPGSCGCCSFVGRKGGSQEVTLSAHCAAYGVVIHELGHVIGFWHEHSRPDRDKFIKILQKNIIPEKVDNFDLKSAGEIDSLGQPYDYYSIMHYRRKTFSKTGKSTMEPRKKGVRIGQREALSPGDIVQASLLYNCPKPKCYEEFTDPMGNFSTPNYPIKYYRSHQCTWIIHAFPGEEVLLEFDDFSVEYSSNCTYDYLEMHEGIDETGPLIGRLCGEGQAGTVRSASSVWLRFYSDKSVALRGFRATYWKQGRAEYSGSSSGDSDGSGASGANDGGGSGEESGMVYSQSTTYTTKCSEYYQARKGHVASPLIPAQYTGQPVECSWTIDGGPNAIRILLAVEVQSLRDTPEICAGDIYRKVRERVRHRGHKHWYKEGSDRLENSLNKDVTGSGQINEEEEATYEYEMERYAAVRYNCQNSKQLLISGNVAMIHWSSDIHHPFSLNYIIDYDECGLQTAACEHRCHNTMQGYTCSCYRGYQLHHIYLHKCVPKIPEFSDKCGSNLTSERGRLRASTEPLEDCVWTIQPPGDLRLIFTFVKFSVPSYVVNGTCLENYIEVYTGLSRSSRGRFCGGKPPGTISTPSNMVQVRLHTNISGVYVMPYFTATYTTYKKEEDAECSGRLKATGSISSPGSPGLYPAHSNCVWRVSAPKGALVYIQLDHMDIETTKMCLFDYLEIRDGRHRTSPLLGRYCGQSEPRSLYSKGRHLWINFLSDKDGSGRGFRVHFSPFIPHNINETFNNLNNTSTSKAHNNSQPSIKGSHNQNQTTSNESRYEEVDSKKSSEVEMNKTEQ